MGISYIIFSAVMPFIAVELTECGLTPSYIGTIIAAYPFGMFISSIGAGYLLPVLGTKRVLLSGIILAAISSILFGSVPEFACDISDPLNPNGANFAFSLYLVFRTMQGFAGGAIETSVIFSNSDLFADILGQVMAYQELAVGLAFMLGPIFGGVLYNFLGFFWTFGLFSVLNCILFGILFFFFPSNIHGPNDEEKLNLLDPEINKIKEDEEETSKQVGLIEVMSLPLFLSFTALFLMNLFFTFLMPFLPLYTQEHFGWGALLSGASVACSAFFYATSSFGVGYTMDQLKIESAGMFKLAYGVGFTLQAFCYWLLGPYPVENSVVSQYSVLIGLSALGLSCGFVSIPTLPDAQFCAAAKKGNSKQLKSLISGIWQATYSFASIVGGPVSGIIYSQWGFVGINFFSAVISLVMGIISLFLGVYWLKCNPFPKK